MTVGITLVRAAHTGHAQRDPYSAGHGTRACAREDRLKPALRTRRCGFTLIEVVLALALTVVVATILSTAVFTVFRAKNSINDSLDVARTANTASDLLEQELANALPPTPSPSSLQANVTGLGSALNNDPLREIGDFEGLADNSTGVPPLDFYTSGPEPKADMQPDVREVVYDLSPDPKGGNMLVRRVYNLLPIDNTVVPPDEVLAHDVVSFTLQYFDGTTWYPTWDSVAQMNTLPFAVEFTIEQSPRKPGEPSRITDRFVPLECGVIAPPASTTGGA